MLIAGHPGDACHGVGRQKDMSMDMTRKRSLMQRLGWLLDHTVLGGNLAAAAAYSMPKIP